jgi:tetratricopeptide (TPR) repeat protein
VNATSNLPHGDRRPAYLRRVARTLFLFAFMGIVAGATPQVDGGVGETFRRRAQEAFEEARSRYQVDTNNVEAAWEFGRTAFDHAEFAGNKAERETIAAQGVAACRRAVLLAPQSAPAHYYLGLNLGQLAKVYLFKGLGIVSEMEKLFLAARKLDPLFDHAGPDRALGLLYHQAPGWPISLGSNAKANRHLNEAVRLRPNYPGNRIALAEFLWATRQPRRFAREWETIEGLIPNAREEFSGPDWELSWVEWNRHLDKLRPHAESLKE